MINSIQSRLVVVRWQGALLRVLALVTAGAALLLAQGCASRPDRAVRDAAIAAELRDLAPDVSAFDLDWFDNTRGRMVPVRIYATPSAITAAKGEVATGSRPPMNAAHRRPVVLFSHGLGGSRFGYSHLGRYWAAQGFLAVHMQHPGTDRSVWGASGLELLGTLRTATSTNQAIQRAQDVRFVIDQLLADPNWSHVADGDRIAIAGHSYGANTALLAAGARFKEDGAVRQYGDPRIKAAIVMSPPSLPSEHNPTFVYTGIQVPTLHLTGTDDYTPIPGLTTQAEDRRVPFDSIAVGPRFLAIFYQGRHSMFNDWSRDETSANIKASTRQLTLAFLRATLLADPTAAGQLASLGSGMASLAVWEAR